MKRLLIMITAIMPLMITSCDFFSYANGKEDSSEKEYGYICLGFDKTDYDITTKAVVGLKDSTEFILSITASDGASVYNGKYGDCPESISVKAGTYQLAVRSISFTSPAFSSPLFGADQYVVVAAGQKVKVAFLCQQLNCGVKITVGKNLISAYPKHYLYLQSDQGKLLYSYTENRIAYFKPGVVSVILSDGTTSKTLFSRSLQERQV